MSQPWFPPQHRQGHGGREEGKEGGFRPSNLRMTTSSGTSARGTQAEVRGGGDERGEFRSAIWFLSGG